MKRENIWVQITQWGFIIAVFWSIYLIISLVIGPSLSL